MTKEINRRNRKEPVSAIALGVAHAVRTLRVEREISQEGLAYKAGINRTYMTDIELGRRSIGIGIIAKLADALGVTMHYILQMAEEYVATPSKENS